MEKGDLGGAASTPLTFPAKSTFPIYQALFPDSILP